MEITGYSRSQLQRRLALLRPVLNGAVRKGPKNKLILEPQVVELLRKLRELEDQGLRPSDAVARLQAETAENRRGAPKASELSADQLVRDLALWRAVAVAWMAIAAVLVALELAGVL